MNKFKVGDRVKIVSNPGRWAHCLSVGSCARVSKVDNTDNSLEVTGDLNGHSCAQWVGFEDVATLELQKIVVTSDGETTTARLFSGKELVKSATAKCSPSDEFVFETGAVLALDRLLDPVTKAKPNAPKFTKADLKTGLFGRMNDGRWFVVVDEKLLYALAEGDFRSGGFDNISSLDESLSFPSGARIDFVLEACSFVNAQDRASEGLFLWSRPGVKFE